MNVRVHDRKANGAIHDIPKRWKGQHPCAG